MIKKLNLIFAFYLFAFCLGEPECGSDPCKDLWTAKKCNKVKHCISEDWSKLKPTGNKDSVCDICLRMVKEARDTLQSNETREQMLEVFEGSCRLLFLKPAVELCDKVVDQLVPELIEILSSQMDPETVCTVSKLCNNDAFRIAQKNSKDCAYCETFTDNAFEKLNSVSLEQFKYGILDLCRTAGGFSDACSYIGSKYSDSLYNNAKSILEKKPCEATLLCPSGSLLSQSGHKSNKRTCSLCVNTMMSLRKQLLNVKSSEEFIENTLTICRRMGYSNSSCSKVSNLAFYKKLKSSDTLPHLLCQVTFCRPTSAEEVPVWPLIPSHSEAFGSVQEFDAVEFLEMLETFFPGIKQEENKVHPKPTIAYGDPIGNPIFLSPRVDIAEFGDCKTCSDVFEVLSGSEKVDDEYLKKSVCDKVQNVEMCNRFINYFSPVLTAAFSEGVVSKKMCEDLVPYCKIKENDSLHDSVSSVRNCSLCENAVKAFQRHDSVEWNKTIEGKCNTLPENSREICKTLSKNLLELLRNSTESEICSFINLCEPSATTVRNESHVHAVTHSKESLCNICMRTLETMSDLLKDKNSEMIIRVVLESICFLLPPEEHKMCSSVVQVLGIDELKKFIENLKPVKACSVLHFCGKREEPKAAALPDLSNGTSKVENMGKVPCKFCLMAMKMLIDELQDDKTEDSIRQALDGLCKYFPEETRDTCRNLVNQYTEEIIDMLVADFNPSEICTFLKICPERHLLGHVNEKNFSVFDVHTNEIRDGNESDGESTLESYKKDGKASVDKAFQKFHEIVQECAMCEALVGVISSHKRMLSKDFSFPANADLICSIVPADKKQKCVSMVVSYGPSIVNLILDQKVDLNDVCVRVDLCDFKLQAKVNQPVSVSEEKFIPKTTNDCMLGPAFWCANAENAEKCGTFLHCEETVWKNWENLPKSPVVP